MPAPVKIDLLEAYRLRTVAGLTYAQIGDLQGVSKQAVSSALYRFRDSLPTQDELAQYEALKVQLLSATEERLLASCADQESIDKASLLDRSRAFKAIHTSLRLEKELSTQNVSSKMSLLITQADSSLFNSQAKPDTSTPDINELGG